MPEAFDPVVDGPMPARHRAIEMEYPALWPAGAVVSMAPRRSGTFLCERAHAPHMINIQRALFQSCTGRV